MRSAIFTIILLFIVCYAFCQITITDANKVQQTVPAQSFLYTGEVILKPGFSVSASVIPGGSWYCLVMPMLNIPRDINRSFVRVESILKEGVTSEHIIPKLIVENKATS